MTTKTAVITFDQRDVAAAVDHLVITALDSTGNGQHVTVKPDVTEVNFDFDPGVYTVKVETFDVAGNAVVPAITSAPFTVEAPATISVRVPVAVDIR